MVLALPEEGAAALPTTPNPSTLSVTNEPANATAKKAFYSPIAAFLRARYPSVRAPPASAPTAQTPVEEPSITDSEQESASEEEEEQDETATIKGSTHSRSASCMEEPSPTSSKERGVLSHALIDVVHA